MYRAIHDTDSVLEKYAVSEWVEFIYSDYYLIILFFLLYSFLLLFRFFVRLFVSLFVRSFVCLLTYLLTCFLPPSLPLSLDYTHHQSTYLPTYLPTKLILEDDTLFPFPAVNWTGLVASAPHDFSILQLLTSNGDYVTKLWNQYHTGNISKFKYSNIQNSNIFST